MGGLVIVLVGYEISGNRLQVEESVVLPFRSQTSLSEVLLAITSLSAGIPVQASGN